MKSKVLLEVVLNDIPGTLFILSFLILPLTAALMAGIDKLSIMKLVGTFVLSTVFVLFSVFLLLLGAA
jgi:hypothetical protein